MGPKGVPTKQTLTPGSPRQIMCISFAMGYTRGAGQSNCSFLVSHSEWERRAAEGEVMLVSHPEQVGYIIVSAKRKTRYYQN